MLSTPLRKSIEHFSKGQGQVANIPNSTRDTIWDKISQNLEHEQDPRNMRVLNRPIYEVEDEKLTVRSLKPEALGAAIKAVEQLSIENKGYHQRGDQYVFESENVAENVYEVASRINQAPEHQSRDLEYLTGSNLDFRLNQKSIKVQGPQEGLHQVIEDAYRITEAYENLEKEDQDYLKRLN